MLRTEKIECVTVKVKKVDRKEEEKTKSIMSKRSECGFDARETYSVQDESRNQNFVKKRGTNCTKKLYVIM